MNGATDGANRAAFGIAVVWHPIRYFSATFAAVFEGRSLHRSSLANSPKLFAANPAQVSCMLKSRPAGLLLRLAPDAEFLV